MVMYQLSFVLNYFVCHRQTGWDKEEGEKKKQDESQREILLTYTFVLCKLCCVPIKTINKTFIIGPLESPESLQMLHDSSKDLQNRQKHKSLRNLNTCGKQSWRKPSWTSHCYFNPLLRLALRWCLCWKRLLWVILEKIPWLLNILFQHFNQTKLPIWE